MSFISKLGQQLSNLGYEDALTNIYGSVNAPLCSNL